MTDDARARTTGRSPKGGQQRARDLLVSIALAAPLAGSLAAMVGIYADSGLLGILAGGASFVILVPVAAPRRRPAR